MPARKAPKTVVETTTGEPPKRGRGRPATVKAAAATVKATAATVKATAASVEANAASVEDTAASIKATAASIKAAAAAAKSTAAAAKSTAVATKRPAKAGTKRVADGAIAKPAKRQKISHNSHASVAGIVLTLGQGDVGQLGLGEDIMEKARPAHVKLDEPIIQVVAGGMHTACLTEKGEVYTFGCNDEGALGRDTSEDGSEMTPAKVVGLDGKIVQLSAGDSHTAGLTDDGRVLIWGSFRDSTGIIGLVKPFAIVKEPMELLKGTTVVKIVSGSDHLVMLTDDGEIYTVGNSEQGQLGRLAECFCVRGGRKGLECLIQPSQVRFKRARSRQPKFEDVWSGAYETFAKEESGRIYGWGLNNYYQLGTGDMENRFVPGVLHSFEGKNWKSIASGLHHTVSLDSEGKVYVSGRAEYGRLGLGETDKSEKSVPTHISTLNGTRCSTVSCGSVVSLAVTMEGKVLSWGMGTNGQLGQEGEDDVYVPAQMLGKQLQNKSVVQVCGGGQHVVLLATQGNSTS